MNKKILALLIISIIAILVITVIIIKQNQFQNQETIKQELQQKFQLLKDQYNEAKADRYDVSEVERLGVEAKQAFDRGDYKKANELLKKTDSLLESFNKDIISPIVMPDPINMPETKEEAREKLSQVKVASLYENITDGVFINRNTDKTIKILKETSTDLIFRGFWKWAPVVNSPDNIPSELFELAHNNSLNQKQASEFLRKTGHYYQELERLISAIKKDTPNTIFVGAIPAQNLGRIEYDPITDRRYKTEETWEMALEPQKWEITKNGTPVTKMQFQNWFYGIHPYGEKIEEYDSKTVSAYFPDITNLDFQELLLSWAIKQIDSGADAIWIDMLYHQAVRLEQITGNVEHPAVKESIEAASKIVNEIHKYGESKGKYIYVGGWGGPFVLAEVLDASVFPHIAANLDFVTVSVSSSEVIDKKLDIARWEKEIPIIKKIYGDVPVFAFIDWSFDQSQLVVFSQELSKEEQKEALKTFDESFAQVDVNFIYPVHGGYMGMGDITTKLSFSEFRIYDSLAPEFDTYETIKELANKKASK